VGRTYPQVFKEGLGFPSVKLEIEFLSPVHYGEHVTVGVSVLKVGRSSVHLQYAASVEGRDVFKARQVAVVVDMKTFKSVPLPDWLRERFLAAAPKRT
jgi:4-hydroxybenzoyl-CoA thioesterase